MLQILVVVGLIAAAWYLLIVRPQRARHGQHERTLGQLSIGTSVMTVGGIFGRVQSIEGETIVLEMAPGMVTRVAADGIARIVADGQAPLPQLPQAPPTHQPAVVAGAMVSPDTSPQTAHEAAIMHDQNQQQNPYQQQHVQAQPFAQPVQPVQLQATAMPPAPQYTVQSQQYDQPFAPPTQQQVTMRAVAQPQVEQPAYEPRPFTAFNLPAPPVFGTPAHAPVQVEQQPQYAAPQQYAPAAPQYAAHQPAPHAYAPVQQPQFAPQPHYGAPAHQQHAPALQPQYVPQPMPAVQPQYAVQPQHAVRPQHAVQPQHAMQHAAPAHMHDAAGAMPQRVRSRAPEGMGATLRLDDPSLRETVDRARRERADLADEYRRLNEPLVTIDQHGAAAQPQMVAMPQQMVAAVPAQPPLFVHGTPAAHVPHPAPQFATPAVPSSIPAPTAFARQTPYSPVMQPTEVAPASA